jgi:hypothetical protein
MDDLLLKELGDLARREEEAERARLDERWDRLAAGTLTAEEEAELKAKADSSPEAREAYAAFRPLGADFQARVVSAINTERAAEAPAPEPREEKPRVLPFRRVVRRFEVWVGAAAAVAAGVFFLVRGPAMQPPISSGVVADLSGGVKVSRGSEPVPKGKPQVFIPGSELKLVVQPRQTIEGPIKARAFLSSSAGKEKLQTLEPEPRIRIAEESGSLILDATMGDDIKISPGDWILWTVVARPNNIPNIDEIQERLRTKWPQYDSWHAVCAALTKEEDPPPAQWQVACSSDFRVEGPPDP